jgi:hypothetical protein
LSGREQQIIPNIDFRVLIDFDAVSGSHHVYRRTEGSRRNARLRREFASSPIAPTELIFDLLRLHCAKLHRQLPFRSCCTGASELQSAPADELVFGCAEDLH